MFVQYNPNPTGRFVADCAVRAISKALDIDWETAYAKLAMNGYAMGDMPNANSVWGALLIRKVNNDFFYFACLVNYTNLKTQVFFK